MKADEVQLIGFGKGKRGQVVDGKVSVREEKRRDEILTQVNGKVKEGKK